MSKQSAAELEDKSKFQTLTIISLFKTLKELEKASSEAHPHIDDPKSDIESCNLCEAISSARIMLLLNKSTVEDFERKFL